MATGAGQRELRRGTPLTIRVHVDALRPIERWEVGFSIDTPIGQMVLASNTELLESPLAPISGPTIVDLRIDEVHFGPGSTSSTPNAAGVSEPSSHGLTQGALFTVHRRHHDRHGRRPRVQWPNRPTWVRVTSRAGRTERASCSCTVLLRTSSRTSSGCSNRCHGSTSSTTRPGTRCRDRTTRRQPGRQRSRSGRQCRGRGRVQRGHAGGALGRLRLRVDLRPGQLGHRGNASTAAGAPRCADREVGHRRPRPALADATGIVYDASAGSARAPRGRRHHQLRLAVLARADRDDRTRTTSRCSSTTSTTTSACSRGAGFRNLKVFDALLDHRFGDSDPCASSVAVSTCRTTRRCATSTRHGTA